MTKALPISIITLFTLTFCCLLSLFSQAQQRLNVMSYNVLNYPLGDLPDRDDTLGVILDYVEPDLLLLQELKTNGGLQTIVAQCNAVLDDVYQSASWVIQQSNPAGIWKLQQNLVYNTSRFSMAEQNVIITPIRDINEYKLLILDDEQESSPNYLYVFVTHLKSSQGAENEASRLASAEVFIEYLSNLPEDAMVLLGGDFNVYTSTEEAYQTLLSSASAIQMVDPIDSPGNWHSSSFPDKEIMTQSTRTGQIFGDGSGGGMDDRFDFVLASENMMFGTQSLSVVPSTYVALGNNGDCYNSTLLNCDNNPVVPPALLSALYYMSDHLPVVFEMESSVPFSVEDESAAIHTPYVIAGKDLVVKNGKNLRISAYSVEGRLVQSDLQAGIVDLEAWLPSGLFILTIETDNGESFTERVLLD